MNPEKIFFILGTASAYATLIPVIIGLINLKHENITEKLFLVLLIFGFITDVLTGFSKLPKAHLLLLFNVYSFLEVIVFSIILYRFSASALVKRLAFIAGITLVALWIGVHLPLILKEGYVARLEPVYESSYQAIIALISGIALFKMIEQKGSAFHSSRFWLVAVIFFNTFSTFFLSLLLYLPFKQYWFIYQSQNIIAYLMLAYGFYLTRKKANHSESTSAIFIR